MLLTHHINKFLILLRLRRPDPWSPRTPLDWILYSPLQWLASLLYRHVLLPLRGCPFHPPSPPPSSSLLLTGSGGGGGYGWRGREYYYCGCGKGRPWFWHYYETSYLWGLGWGAEVLRPLMRGLGLTGYGSVGVGSGSAAGGEGAGSGDGADGTGSDTDSVSTTTGEERRGRGPRRPIRVVCLSDTHNLTLSREQVPDGDLLIHCGDLTVNGTVEEVQRQVDWLKGLPHRWKVVVGGNHDYCLGRKKTGSAGGQGGEEKEAEKDEQQQEVNWDGVEYLCDRLVELRFDGGRCLNVYGWGVVPEYGDEDYGLTYPREKHPWQGRIPDETDVLVTHTPPAHHLDLSLGCAGLLDEVWRVKPRLHVFGHVHRAHGAEAVYYDECQRAYEAIMSRQPKGPLWDLLVPGAHWLDFWDMVRHGIGNILWKWIMLGPGTNNGGLMVNAALMYGDSGVLRNPVAVVDL
ncbi:hypothetical protein VTJ04DRAFT_4587 [Mycothermus thermophilus]|uniref:uncharacterized protein n=1 Tax=Humicola insolens TaxID=85995 RepID=UPI003743BE14